MRSDHSTTWYKHGINNLLHASVRVGDIENVCYTLVAIPIRMTKPDSEKACHWMIADYFLSLYFS